MAKRDQKSHAVAIFLAVFVGTLGIDRFYLGHTGLGITKLVLTLSFVGLIVTVVWALVDLILIVTGKDKYNLK